MPPVDRLVKMIDLLKRRRRTSMNYLADACQVSNRTVYRDLNALIGLGYPVQSDHGYYLLSEAERNPVDSDQNKLAADDITLLKFCIEQNPLAGIYSFRKQFRKILGKLQTGSDSMLNNSHRLFQYQATEGDVRQAPVDLILEKFESALKADRCISLKLHHARQVADVLIPIKIKLRRSGVWLVIRERLSRRTRKYPLVSIKALSIVDSPAAASEIREAN